MKAVQIDEYGDVSVLKLRDIPKPAPGAGQVVVEVHASSLNPFDTSVRSGAMRQSMPLKPPITLGGDLAGVVTAVADDVKGLQPGDKVYGQANAVAGNSGAFAEYAATSANQLAKMPGNLDFTQAAALPLVGVSAWQALTRHIKLYSGQTIFIHGGAGGIGTVAIQIAKHIGAKVITTATGDGVPYVKRHGADEVIDYKQQDFTSLARNCDAAFDTVGGDEFNKALRTLKPGGIGVSMIARANEDLVNELQVTAITQSTKVTTEALDALRQLIEAGVVTPHVDTVFPLDQIQSAFTLRESGKAIGKVVIQIKS